MAPRHIVLALLAVAGLYFAGVVVTSVNLTPDDAAGTETATPTPDFDPEGPYASGFEPGYDLDRVFDRVERLRGLESNATVPVTTYRAADERVHGEPHDAPDEFVHIDRPGARLLLVRSNASVPPSVPLGYADAEAPTTVSVHVMARTDLREHGVAQRAVLAHEFVHVLQHQHGLNDLEPPPETATTDRVWARWAVYEGDAMLTQLAYQRRYDVEGFEVDRYRRTDAADPRGSWPSEFSRASYYYGTRYLRAQNATNGTARNAALRDPPATTRLLLHPDATPANRSVRLPTTLADGRYASIDHDQFGELAVRRALVVNGLPRERAVAAATGWRDGYASVYYGGSGETGAWRTAWANTSEAREFLAAYRVTLRRLDATQTNGTWRVATETTPETFYRLRRTNATVTIVAGPNRTAVGGVTASLPEANATASA